MKKNILGRITVCILMVTFFSSNSYAAKAYIDYSEKCRNKITAELSEIMSYTDDEIPVMIWLDHSTLETDKASIIEEVYKDKNITTAEQIENLSNTEKLDIVHKIREKNSAKMKQLCTDYIDDCTKILQKYGETNFITSYAPCVAMSLTSNQIDNLSKNQHIINISARGKAESIQLLDDSREAIRANIVQTNQMLGQTGNGVRVGIIDEELPIIEREALSTANIVLHDFYQSSSPKGIHATWCAEIIASQGSNVCAVGIAPDVTLYCTFVPNNSEMHFNSLDWLVEQGVDIVSISLNWSTIDRNGQPIYNQYYSFSQVLDYYSAQYLITFVVANGNSGADGVGAPALSYNAISVGNVDDNNTTSVTDDEIYYSSSHINQLSLTNLPSKPDLCAPGTNIYLDTVSTTGTSYSAPHVAGAAALIGETDPFLLISPVAIKATLIAGVSANFHFVPSQRTITTNTANPPESYIQCGAGLIDCRRSVTIAKYYQTDFSVLKKEISEVSFTINCNANISTRVALTFEKTTTLVNDIFQLYYYDNLDLYIYDPNGNLVGSSITTNNNVEIVDFTTSSAGNYTVKIKRIATDHPSDVRYAYAWL